MDNSKKFRIIVRSKRHCDLIGTEQLSIEDVNAIIANANSGKPIVIRLIAGQALISPWLLKRSVIIFEEVGEKWTLN